MQTTEHLSDLIGESVCFAELFGVAEPQPLGDHELGL
jgi:hypothetical protein